jgi:peroxiredoxin
MAAIASSMMPLGTSAPAFALPDVVTQKTVTLANFASDRALVIIFLCRHCPYVVHVQNEFVRLGNEYQPLGIGFVAISANDALRYPADAPDSLKEMALELKLPYPLLYDESQSTARNYRAACTPDFFLFNEQRHLFYRGRMDESRPGNGKPVNGADLRAALEAVRQGQPAQFLQNPSMGCGIKWKPGHAPL